MIGEEATYKEFGYYARDLKPHSHKKIIAICDDCKEIRILMKQDYCKLCRSCSHKEKQFSEEHRKNMGNAQKGEKNHNWKGGNLKRICEECNRTFYVKPSKIERGEGKFCSISCGSKASIRHRKFPTHHTKPELIFEAICKKNKLPFKYTGDGSFWIHNINPDFIECNGKKLVVEIFGDYWHSPLLNSKLREDRTLTFRKKLLKRYGYKLIVFWETDLLREDAETFVLKNV